MAFRFFSRLLSRRRSFYAILAGAFLLGIVPVFAITCDPAYCDQNQAYSQACEKYSGAAKNYNTDRCSWQCYYGGVNCQCYVVVCGVNRWPCLPQGNDIYRDSCSGWMPCPRDLW